MAGNLGGKSFRNFGIVDHTASNHIPEACDADRCTVCREGVNVLSECFRGKCRGSFKDLPTSLEVTRL